MTSIVMEEIPERLTLALAISNCRGLCVDCHSAFLREDIGDELNENEIDRLISDNFGIDCFLFLGEGRDMSRLLSLAQYVKDKYALAIALYSGRNTVEKEVYELFDYIKLGAYIPQYGALNQKSTNQRLYKIVHTADSYCVEDITYMFWR